MSDVDLGPAITNALIFLLIIFTIGGSFFSILLWTLFLRKTRVNILIKFFIFICIFVLGGLLTIKILTQIENIITNGSKVKQRNFINQMKNDYQIVNVNRFGNIIKIKYRVPSNNDYSIHVYGFSNMYNKMQSFQYDNSIIKEDIYKVSLKRGDNEYSIKLNNEQLISIPYLDFQFLIFPLQPTKNYNDDYWQKRFFTVNLGPLSEGMNFCSDHIYYCNDVLSNSPETSTPRLHIKLN